MKTLHNNLNFIRKGRTGTIALLGLLLSANLSVAQTSAKDPVVERIIKEATENSQLEILAHELMDGIGPRLVGPPQLK